MRKTVLAGVAMFAMATAAQAVIVTSSPLDVNPAAGENLVLDFESTTPPAGYSITGSGFGYYTGTTPGVAAAPAGDATQYLAVLAGGSATIGLPTPLKSFSIYIGSVDAYNTFTLSLVGGGSQSFTGVALTGVANGDQSSGATNRRFFFTAEGSEQISGITLTSTQNSFEVDNLATAAIPEPASWAMMLAGFGLVGFAARRRSRAVAA